MQFFHITNHGSVRWATTFTAGSYSGNAKMVSIIHIGRDRIDSLLHAIFSTLVILVLPAVVLALVHGLTARGTGLPPQLLELQLYGPYGALAVGGFISAGFNRGRVFLALLGLSTAYLFYRLLISGDIDSDVVGRAFAMLCILVPLNLAALTLIPERGLFNAFGFRRLLIIALQVAVVVGSLLVGRFNDVPDFVLAPLPQLTCMHANTIPPRALPFILLGIVLAVVGAVLRDGPIEKALCGAIVAFALACSSAERPSEFGLLISIAALLIIIGILRDSYRMAFRDELTGLPNRRAFNERMMSLGHRFAIAMLDIDHFKRFNDTYGHTVGDQVLKMVAAKLRQVQGGGRAFRYGGEEFTLVFPACRARRVLQELETLRVCIAQHCLALRSPHRPAEANVGRRLRASNSTKHGVYLTVSIGVAACNHKQCTPEQVLHEADQALYRAKEKGRNCVSY
jgi:diguanylate cyclase (GGDEF)-like protein